MAGAMVSAPVTAAQIAQQKLQDQGAQQLKQGASKFDQTMANKAQQTQGPSQVDAAQKAQATSQVDAAQKAQSVTATQSATKVDSARHVESVNKSERASMRRTERSAPSENAAPRAQEVVAELRSAKAEGTQGSGMMIKMASDLEKGQGVMDKLIEAGLSGRQFSSSELLALQAGMYKYTQELELTGKVVEKATSGLKDTLKTQV